MHDDAVLIGAGFEDALAARAIRRRMSSAWSLCCLICFRIVLIVKPATVTAIKPAMC
jgi:hypothetical protein